jgi:GT2 family glycosyltransferase
MQLSVIIPTKNRGEVFKETLAAVEAATAHLDAEIIVINDSKTSQPLIPALYRHVTLFDNPKSGVASARNLGASLAKADLLLFLDDDILVSRASIDHILDLHRCYPNACFNVNWEYPPAAQQEMEQTQFGRFMKTHGMTSFKGWYNDPSWRDNMLFSSRSVASFHLSVMRDDFRKTKGYNEQFPNAGFEDYDFPLQLRKAGLSFYIDTRITIFHNEADRLRLSNWLDSQERRAGTRRVAVDLGYDELRIVYGLGKKIILSLIAFFSPLLLVMLTFIPNRKRFDPAYFMLLGAIQAGRIYKGYTMRNR